MKNNCRTVCGARLRLYTARMSYFSKKIGHSGYRLGCFWVFVALFFCYYLLFGLGLIAEFSDSDFEAAVLEVFFFGAVHAFLAIVTDF